MKLKGKTLSGPNMVIIAIPRNDGDIILKAQAVLDYEEFEKICPRPAPPEILKPNNVKSLDINDPDYLKSIEDWAIKKSCWMTLKSLEATEDLEWETVDMSDPDTYVNYKKELTNAGFVDGEIVRIISGILEANALNQEKIDEAMKRFLVSQEVIQEK